MRRGLLGCVLFALLTVACEPAPSATSPQVTVPQLGSIKVWALGDSQGALSNNPARGLPWTQRLGAAVGNGADAMEGAGWTVPGTFTSRTIAQQATAIASANTVTKFVVMAGVNDLKVPRTVAQMMAGVDALEATASAERATVLYVGIVPVPAGATISNRNATRLAFNSALSQRFGARYVDCSSTMATAAGWLQPGYSLAPDDLHLSSAGEQALANCIAARL